MIVVVSIAETYVQKVLVSVPDNTKNAEQVARNYVEGKYHIGDLRLDINQADYLDQSGEVSVSYSDPNEKKYGSPDFILNEKGVEDEQKG